MQNKYDQINIMTLVLAIQQAYIRAEKKTRDGKRKYTVKPNKLKELRDMKDSARRGLSKMNRNRPEYFPVGSYVVYKPYRPSYSEDDWDAPIEKELDATVTGYEGEYCNILIEGNEMPFKVSPATLTLKFLRENV